MKKQYFFYSSKLLFFVALFSVCYNGNAHIDTVLVSPSNSFTFSPANFTMSMGDTVRWVWESGSHTTTSTSIPTNAASWDSPMNSSIQTYTYVPTELGTYDYVCTPHASNMMGSFTVVCNIDTSVYSNNDTLRSNSTTATYQWVDCNNNYTGLAKDSNQVFVPTVNGTYAVILTQNACVDTSLCYNVTVIGLEEEKSLHMVEIFPNPSNGIFKISNATNFKSANITVFNSIGKKVYENNEYSGSAVHIDISDKSKGVYFLEIRENEKTLSSKLIVK